MRVKSSTQATARRGHHRIGVGCSQDELLEYPAIVQRLKESGALPSGMGDGEVSQHLQQIGGDMGGMGPCWPALHFRRMARHRLLAGRKASDLKKMGFSVKELAEDYDAAEVFRAGYSKAWS